MTFSPPDTSRFRVARNAAPMVARSAERGSVSSLVFFLAILGTMVAAVVFLFGVTISPGSMGVRQINFGPGQGFSSRALPPGLHWTIPFYSEIHLVPANLQMFHFQREEQGLGGGPLEIQTSDRAAIDVDATVLARFFREPGEESAGKKHGGPAELMGTVGVLPGSWENKVRRAVDDALKRTLGTLSTGQFYDPSLREEQVSAAVNLVNQGDATQDLRGLAPQGIKVEAILIRRYVYRDERIEAAIFQKNLQDQEEALNVAESKLAEAQANSSQEEARGEARNRTLVIEGENKVRVIRSEGDLYEAERKAEADLLVSKAVAEVDRQKAGALARSAGMNTYVAREMAPLVSSLKGGVLSGVDPYDIDQWVKKLGVRTGRAQP